MNRPSMPEVHMRFALDLANRSTCNERSVGCVITSSDFENVYSVGYNGNYVGGSNGCDHKGHKCGCLHAEVNALIKCYVKDKDKVAFVTLAPCENCAKAMINSGFSKVYYAVSWKDNPGIQLLNWAGVECIQLAMMEVRINETC
jgi:dCMP deaminase